MRHGRLRFVVILVSAAVLVVAIALAVGLFVGVNSGPSGGVSLTPDRLGPTDVMTGADTAGLPAMPSPPGREVPSRQEWAQLLPTLEKAVQTNPGDVTAKRKLALAYYNLGHLPQAKATYDGLLAVEENAVLRNRLGNTLRDMGNSAAAEEAYGKAIADDPKLAPPYLNLSELLWREGRTDKAIAIIDQGLTAVPQDSRAVLEQAHQVITSGT